VELDDLVHAGIVGLIDALKKYDPAKNVQFRSYAQFRIRGAILDGLRELDWSPRELRRKARSIEDAAQRLANKLGRAATEQEIAEELGMKLHDYQLLLGELRGLEIGSIQAVQSDDAPEEELSTYIPADPQDDPFVLCLRSQMQEKISEAITDLPERERQVLALYYYEELTMKEIGEVMGVVESRVSQLHTSAVIRLRAKMKNSTRPSRPMNSGSQPLQMRAV
jgi:RNA polymerase sigma factor for flagellar operon FliA